MFEWIKKILADTETKRIRKYNDCQTRRAKERQIERENEWYFEQILSEYVTQRKKLSKYHSTLKAREIYNNLRKKYEGFEPFRGESHISKNFVAEYELLPTTKYVTLTVDKNLNLQAKERIQRAEYCGD